MRMLRRGVPGDGGGGEKGGVTDTLIRFAALNPGFTIEFQIRERLSMNKRKGLPTGHQICAGGHRSVRPSIFPEGWRSRANASARVGPGGWRTSFVVEGGPHPTEACTKCTLGNLTRTSLTGVSRSAHQGARELHVTKQRCFDSTNFLTNLQHASAEEMPLRISEDSRRALYQRRGSHDAQMFSSRKLIRLRS